MSNPSKHSNKQSSFNILILGGTSDARRLADQLIKLNQTVIYSIAGLVRTPDLACQVHVGGFSESGGLTAYIEQNHIGVILDATHPYALTISKKAIDACVESNIQYVRFERPEWKVTANDKWTMIDHWQQLLNLIPQFKRIFLSAGQVPSDVLQMMMQTSCHITLRTAKAPDYQLPENIVWIKAIGPFDELTEKKWLKKNQIDLIVSKNSGGQATYGKIAAARKLGITVAMFNRPNNIIVSGENLNKFDDLAHCIDCILKFKN